MAILPGVEGLRTRYMALSICADHGGLWPRLSPALQGCVLRFCSTYEVACLRYLSHAVRRLCVEYFERLEVWGPRDTSYGAMTMMLRFSTRLREVHHLQRLSVRRLARLSKLLGVPELDELAAHVIMRNSKTLEVGPYQVHSPETLQLLALCPRLRSTCGMWCWASEEFPRLHWSEDDRRRASHARIDREKPLRAAALLALVQGNENLTQLSLNAATHQPMCAVSTALAKQLMSGSLSVIWKLAPTFCSQCVRCKAWLSTATRQRFRPPQSV